MNGEFLLDAIGDAEDRYILEAQQLGSGKMEPLQTRKKARSWKLWLLAAVIPLLAITAYATDFLNIRSLSAGEAQYTSSAYQQMEQAMEQAGFRMDVKERFGSGYTFDNVIVRDTSGQDENGQEVLTYSRMIVEYRTSSGNRLLLSAEPYWEEIPHMERPAAQSRVIGEIQANYYVDHYKFVPEDYELTEAEKAWEQQPGNYISYGSDEVEETTTAFLSWEKDGIYYFFMDTGAQETPDTLFSMAEELING